jgi:hypothetical protein
MSFAVIGSFSIASAITCHPDHWITRDSIVSPNGPTVYFSNNNYWIFVTPTFRYTDHAWAQHDTTSGYCEHIIGEYQEVGAYVDAIQYTASSGVSLWNTNYQISRTTYNNPIYYAYATGYRSLQWRTSEITLIFSISTRTWN